MSGKRRAVTVSACCLVAAATPFIAGVMTGLLGVLLLGYAVWLIALSGWSAPARLWLSILAVTVTIGLFVGVLFVVMGASGD